MRVPINLASQPYENLRPFYSGIALALLLLMALTMTVVWKARQNRNETRMLTEQSEQLDQDLASLRREQRDLTLWLGRPDVQEIRDRSAFLNSLIVRKSLSWTQMFMDLEKVLPEKVQVTAIRPSPNESAQAQLNLTVSAASIAPLVEFLKNLEASAKFAKPKVDSQRFPAEKAQDPNIVLELSVFYHQTGEAGSLPAPVNQSRDRNGAVQSVDIANAVSGPRLAGIDRGSESRKGAR